MQENDKLKILKKMIETDDTDDILSTYLNIAGKKIINKAFPYSKNVIEVPDDYNLLQCEIAAYLLNKRGAEGQTAHSENGVMRTYENADIPSSMLKQIVPNVGVFR